MKKRKTLLEAAADEMEEWKNRAADELADLTYSEPIDFEGGEDDDRTS